MAEHDFNKEHHMQFHNTEILSTIFQPIGHTPGNTKLIPTNTCMNKKYGFVFCRSQESLIHSLKEQWEPPHGVMQLQHYGLVQSHFCP
jgi:hypothetical protein